MSDAECRERLGAIQRILSYWDVVYMRDPNEAMAALLGIEEAATRPLEPGEQAALERGALVIVPAPGDRCGGSRVLPNDQKCPGCRACS